MSIVWTHQLAKDRTSAVAVTANGVIVTYRRMYQVLTDDETNGEAYILQNAGLPAAGSLHPEDPSAVLVNYDAKQVDDSRLLWEVEVTWSNDRERFDGELIGPNVWRSISSVSVPRVIWRDTVTGQPITNSAGIPYSREETTFPRANLLATFTRNELSFDDNQVLQFQNHVNSAPFYGYPSLSLLCRSVSAQESFATDGGVLTRYWQVQYTFEYSYDGWELVLLDAGFMAKLKEPPAGADADKLHPIRIKGSQVAEPYPLDGNGFALVPPTPANFVFNEFNVFPLADFNVLGL